MRCPLWAPSQLALPAYPFVRRAKRIMAGMTRTDGGKARWAQARSASLEEQARILVQERGGDWQARERRRRAADGLRNQAAHMRQIARRLLPGAEHGDDLSAVDFVF